MDRTVRLTAAVTPDGDWYVARCLDVEVASQGRTIDEALANLREALELYFEDQPAPDAPEPIGSHVGGTQDRRESSWPHLVMQGTITVRQPRRSLQWLPWYR